MGKHSIMNKIIRLLKNNRFVRGLYFLFRRYFGYSKIGKRGTNVVLSPP